MKKNDEYYVIFKGAKLSKLEANRVGVGVVFGVIGAIVNLFLPFKEYKLISHIMLLVFVLVGYFVVGPKVFKG